MKAIVEKLLFWKKTTFAVVVLLVIALGAVAGLSYAWAQQYDGRIAPRVRIGAVDVSGLSQEEALEEVRRATDELLSRGIEVDLEGRRAAIPLITVGGDATEDVAFDAEAAVAEALLRHRSAGNKALDVLLLLRARFLGPDTRLAVPAAIARPNVERNLRAAFPEAEVPFKEASFALTRSREGWQATATDGSLGRAFDTQAFFRRFEEALGALDAVPVPLTLETIRPTVNLEATRLLEGAAVAAMEAAPYLLAERPDGGRTWELPAAMLAKMLRPAAADGTVVLDVDPALFDAYLDTTAKALEVEAQDARFQVVDGKVTEFATSKDGLALDREQTRRALVDALGLRDAVVPIALAVTTPAVTTDDGNDLGITDELGVGTSSFKGSPGNRVKNIRNGVKLLNGLLIPPESTFSLIEALQPFTLGNGYLPELVIKGNKIEPELGGGLCQIGTTTFRAAMNAGLPIAERRNHSLVVSYYNDPANGNPGTDATIYEPAPDLKFTNDTGHYVLFQASMNEAAQALTFRFWGTSDGREGSYTPPKVLRWIPHGDQVDTPTETLPVGEERCQAPHVGADTTFTYSIARPDGTMEETVFDSHYRPLPKICLVGTGVPATPVPMLEESPAPVSTPVPTP